MTRYRDRYFRFAPLLLLAGVYGLAGCGEDNDKSGADVAGPNPPAFEHIPDCARVAGILGDLVADLIPSDDDQGRYQDSGSYGVNCSWLTPRVESDNAFEVVKGGALSVGITVDRAGDTDEDILRGMGMIHDDPRVEAIGGFVVDMSGKLDPDAQLAMVGPQVVVGKVTVTFAAGGMYLQKVEEMRGITNDRVIEAAVALHRSLD